MVRIYLGLGSNVGDRQANIRRALAMLAQRGIEICSVSPLYETEPWGVQDQPSFLNAACAAGAKCPPESLLNLLKDIEGEMGRAPTVRYGPRPIDLDILTPAMESR